MSGYAIVASVAATSGLLIGLLQTFVNNRPLRQLRRARRDFEEIVKRYCPNAEIFVFGGKATYPTFWIASPTDAERDMLAQDATLIEQFREALAKAGYPAIDIPLAQFQFESQITVDREFEGSWSRRHYAWHRRRYG